MTAKRITLDAQTKSDAAIAVAGRKYRRMLESLVEAEYGSVRGDHIHHINSAARNEQSYKRWRKKQRLEEEGWTIDQAIRVEELIDRKLTARDAAYKRLGIDTSSEPQLQTMSQQDRFKGIMDDIQATQGRHPCNVETDRPSRV